jgi:adenylate cyclase
MAGRRRLVSYPLSLALVVATLVALSGGFIAWWNYRSGKSNVAELSRTLFDQVARQTADATRDFLGRAPPAAEALRRLAELDPVDPPRDAIARRLLAVLSANPGFTWVSWSDPAGGFVGAYRPATGGLRINRSEIVGGKTPADDLDVLADGTWQLRDHKDDTGYDPRTRPFYVEAVRARRRIWTQPYVFFEGVPGITCAEPVIAADGTVRGVFTIDFDLNQLSKFVRELRFTEHGRVAVLAADGTVLAHPTAAVVAHPGEGKGALLTSRDLADRVLEPAAAAAARGARTFDVDGVAYLSRAVDIPVDGQLTWTALAYAPESDLTGDLYGRVVTSLVISVVAVLVAVAIAWLLARRVSGPLTVLADEMAEVGEFRLDDREERHSAFREIEMMYGALAKMKGGLRSFASYVPRDLVRAVLASGQDARLSGETRDLTVFFSDLAGFTTIAEDMAPDALVRFLGGYFDDMSTIIAGEQGTVDKYLGDGIMAFWGAPAPLLSHAARACAAALACHARVSELAAGGARPCLAARDVLPAARLTVRIGLATGDVLVGNIGSSQRLNYTVMGDTANLAARLESLNKQYGTTILISEATRIAAGDAIVARPIDVVAVKGKARGIRVFELLALAGDRDAAAVALAVALAADSTAALDAYLARDFPGAAARWGAIADARPDDRAATTMRDRARGFAASPPPESWDGVTIATEK